LPHAKRPDLAQWDITTLIDFHYLARYIAELKSFAGTGCLVCHDGKQQCLLYYQFGILIHAQLGEKLGPSALSDLLRWQYGQIHFQPRLTYTSQSLSIEQEEIFMRTLSFLQKRSLLESSKNQASSPGFQVQGVPAQVSGLEYQVLSSEFEIFEAASQAGPDETENESFKANSLSQDEEATHKVENPETVTLPEVSLLAPVSFDLSNPPAARVGNSLTATGLARHQGDKASSVKVFKLAERFLPPAVLLKLEQDADFLEHSRMLKPDLRWLLKRTAHHLENGYLTLDYRRNVRACYIRLFYYEGQLVEAAFDDGNNLVEDETALQLLFRAEPPALSQIRLGKVDPRLLKAYFATQKAGRTLFTAIPAVSLDLRERLTSLAQHRFSGAVKFYNSKRVIFYLMNDGEGLGGYEVQRGVLARVKTSLDTFVTGPKVLVDIYPGLSPQPLLVAESPSLNLI